MVSLARSSGCLCSSRRRSFSCSHFSTGFRNIEVSGVLRMRSYRILGRRARRSFDWNSGVPRVLLRLRVRACHGFRRAVQPSGLYRCASPSSLRYAASREPRRNIRRGHGERSRAGCIHQALSRSLSWRGARARHDMAWRRNCSNRRTEMRVI